MSVWGKAISLIVWETRRPIPLFLEKCFSFILQNHVKMEGIFRVPGLQTSILKYIAKLELHDDIIIENDTDPFVICNLITRFYKFIPNHVLDDSKAEKYQKCTNEIELKKMVNSLSIENIFFLSRLIGFMKIVDQNSSFNKMNAKNLSVICSPILLDNPKEPSFFFDIKIVELFFTHYTFIFESYSSLNKNGEWLSYEEFEQITKFEFDQIFIRSGFKPKVSKSIDETKQLKIKKNIQIKEIKYTDLLQILLKAD